MQQVPKMKRFVGQFIDGVVFSIPYYIFTFLAGITGIYILAVLGYLIFLVGYLLRDALFGGRSFGKKIMGYKVVLQDGTSLAGNYKASFIRNISLLIPLIDAIMVLTDKPRLGDNWAGTKVLLADAETTSFDFEK